LCNELNYSLLLTVNGLINKYIFKKPNNKYTHLSTRIYIEFEYKDGKIFYENNEIPNALSTKEQGIVVNFIKKEKDNPKINAILLVQGGLEDTDHESYKNQLEELERQTVEKERKHREFQKRSNDYDYEDFEDDFVDDDPANKRVSSIFNPSFMFLSSLSIFFIYHLFLKGKSPQEVDVEDN